LPLLRQRRPRSELYQAARSPLPPVFRQTVWVSCADQEDEGQEVAAGPPRDHGDRARRGSVPFLFHVP